MFRPLALAVFASATLALAGCGGSGAAPTGSPAPTASDQQGDPRVTALLGKALLPDLNSQPPKDFSVEQVAQGTRIRLTNTYGNVGMGPLHLEGVTIDGETHAIQHVQDAQGQTIAQYDTSVFEWHASHGHWHINDVSRYALRRGAPNGPVVAESTKVTFCMIDLQHTYPKIRNGDPDGEYWGCGDEFQGLSVGWSDVYSAGLADQWIYITDLPRGIYWLVTTVDPTGQFLERDDIGDAIHANNSAWAKIRLDPQRRTVTTLGSGYGDPAAAIQG